MFDAVESIVMQVTADDEKRVAVASLSASYKAGRRASINMELTQAYDASQHDELVRKAAAEFLTEVRSAVFQQDCPFPGKCEGG